MSIQSPVSRRTSLVSASVVILAFTLLPTAAPAQRGGGHGGNRGGGHHGGGSQGGGHYGGGHGGWGHGRGHHGGQYGGHWGWGYGYGYPYYGSYSSYSPYYYGLYGSWPYGRSWGSYVPYGSYYPSGYDGPDFGAIDIDLAPDNVAVYEAGRLLGSADDFDGFPSYLWLSEGTHELTFYLDGYRSLVHQVVVNPARIVSVDGSLEAGESSPPEAADYADSGGDLEVVAQGPQAAPRENRVPADLRRTPARLLLSIEPEDATVYLDGRFIGTGAAVSAGVILDPGTHILEVVRPERLGSVWSFDIAAGSEVEQRIELAHR